MNLVSRVVASASVALVLGGAALSAAADVPGRVGRISFLQGDVQSYSDVEPDWKGAYLNQPVTSHNSLFVGDSGRAEISVGSTTLAIDAGSQIDIDQLDDNTFNANVVRGRVSLQVRRVDPGDSYDIAVPGADFSLLQPGRYRIDALAEGSGVTVFAGQASMQTDRGAVLVQAGTAMRVGVARSNAPNGAAASDFQSVPPVNVALDDWVLARDARFRDGQAARYVSPNMTGYEDLDANGRWVTDPELGPVWYPTTYVQNDWVPYRYGRWAYVAPWGYTWIDDAPWGFAPFHYGRWAEVGGRWGWCPGAYVARPAYAPALVGFYGGSGFSVSFSAGPSQAVGWYPLAPWERFSPQYTRNAVYLQQVNNIRVVNPPPRFERGAETHDWNRFHGGTVAPQEAFVSQRSISRVAIGAPREAFIRGAAIEAAALPRPASIPAGGREGPRPGQGFARPDFRRPSESGTRPEESRSRGAEGYRIDPAVPSRPAEAAAPPIDRRVPEAARVPQAIQTGEAPRFEPRTQPRNRIEGEARTESAPFQRPQAAQPAEAPQAIERPHREMRNIQPRPQQAVPVAPAVPVPAQPQAQRPPQAQPQQRGEVPRPNQVNGVPNQERERAGRIAVPDR